jgi:hypothetical protein
MMDDCSGNKHWSGCHSFILKKMVFLAPKGSNPLLLISKFYSYLVSTSVIRSRLDLSLSALNKEETLLMQDIDFLKSFSDNDCIRVQGQAIRAR